MSQWRVTEVDGVPAVWDDVPGPFTGALLVRVGHVDETLARHGVTHMLEHLALHGLDHPGEHSNGRVDATSMLLHATGTPDDVAAFLARAAAQLAAPPVDGAANDALIEFLARALGVRRADVTIQRGETGRRKTVRVAGVSAAQARAAL